VKIVVAPQALKGSLDAADVGRAIDAGIRAVAPRADVLVVPVADGGEGTVTAMVAATGGVLRTATVTGPLGEPVQATWGMLGGEGPTDARPSAVIEMAAASGLPLVPLARRDPRVTTTFGTGELIRSALDAGCTRILIGIGGSATNDGGAGMAHALGAHLLDAEGAELPEGGSALARLARIDVSTLDRRLRQTEVRAACDVTNPLVGPLGASAVYGPQKGATPEMVGELDASLAHYAEVLRRDLGVDVASVPGAGAAGGLGAGLLAFASASLVPGARLVLDAVDFASKVAGAALVITAEGQLDVQTMHGKSVGAVAAAAKQAGAAVIALTGRLAADDATLARLGIDAALPLADGPITLEESVARAAELVTTASARAMRLLLLGRGLTSALGAD
jgi:glycerate 2-kinase